MPSNPQSSRPQAEQTSLEKADIAFSERVAAERKSPAIKALGTIAELGDQPPLFGLCAGVLAFGLLSGRRRLAAAGANMLLSLTIATAAKTAVKNTVSRTRPNVLFDEGIYDVEPLGPDEGPWHSFPSGHTAGSVAVARALARTIPEAAIPGYAAAAAVAVVQLPTAHHFLSDVLAGAAIGLAADLAAAGIAELAPGILTSEPDPEPGPELG